MIHLHQRWSPSGRYVKVLRTSVRRLGTADWRGSPLDYRLPAPGTCCRAEPAAARTNGQEHEACRGGALEEVAAGGEGWLRIAPVAETPRWNIQDIWFRRLTSSP